MSDITILSQIILASATGLGAFGGFPEPPKIFKDIIKYEFIKWILLAILVWQGGGGSSSSIKKDILITILITTVMYVGKIYLDKAYDATVKKSKNV